MRRLIAAALSLAFLGAALLLAHWGMREGAAGMGVAAAVLGVIASIWDMW